ncbi:MAG TPA: metallopeptidase TldD-related protein, partial [Nitrososphaerales archaeon]|nr:metallopeptidase TldD-related protein [Nitrososphaerales archaeon]
MDLESLNEVAVSEAKKLGADDAVALTARMKDRMIRFANNTVTTTNQVEETELTAYLAHRRRRAIASTSNLESANIRKFVRDLFDSLRDLPESEYAPLPGRASKHARSSLGVDKKIEEVGERLPEFAKAAIDASVESGGKRSAGVIDAVSVSTALLASTGTKGSDERSSITLNIRSFAEKDASGHGLSCASTLTGFDPEEAGRKAGSDAKRMRDATEPEAGSYQVLLSPTVASNLVEIVGMAASAFSIDAGTSYLVEKLGKKVASESFSLT